MFLLRLALSVQLLKRHITTWIPLWIFFLESFIIKMMQIWLNKYVKEDFINHLVLFLEINNATTLVNNSLWRAINNTFLKVSCVSFWASTHLYPFVWSRHIPWSHGDEPHARKKIVYRKINRYKQNQSCFNLYVFFILNIF